MAYSTQRATSDGTLSTLALSLEYFDRAEITVFIDGSPIPVGSGWSWVGSTETRISFSPVIPAGGQVLVKRSTDMSAMRHQFSKGAQFIAEVLDEDYSQILRIAQEAKEGTTLSDVYNDVDFHTNRIRNLGDGINPTDGVNMRQVAAITGVDAAQTAADRAATQALYNDFGTRYLGAYSAPPSTGPGGAALIVGALYWDSQGNTLRVWGGAQWFSPTTYNASTLNFTPTPSLVSSNVQDAIVEVFNHTRPSFKNRIINGDFRVAQRGTTGLIPLGGGYTIDRWVGTATGKAIGWGQVLTSSAGEGGMAAIAMAGEAGNTGVQYLQRIESANCRDLAGGNVTVSFVMYQSTGATIQVRPALVYSGGAPDSWGSQVGLTPLDPATSVPSGVWTTVVNRFTLPPEAVTGLGLYPWANQIAFNAAGKDGRLARVQLEAGDIATRFERRPYSLERSLCRYYYAADSYTTNVIVGVGQALTTGKAFVQVPLTGDMFKTPLVSVTGSLARLGGELVGAPQEVGYGPSGVSFSVVPTSAFVAGNSVMLAAVGTCVIARNSEL